MSHTPTPWYCTTDHTDTVAADSEGSCIVAELVVATIYSKESSYRHPPYGTGRANAEFICLACNAHGDLVAALRRQVENIERWIETGTPAGPDESQSIYNQLEAALFKAEGME